MDERFAEGADEAMPAWAKTFQKQVVDFMTDITNRLSRVEQRLENLEIDVKELKTSIKHWGDSRVSRRNARGRLRFAQAPRDFSEGVAAPLGNA